MKKLFLMIILPLINILPQGEGSNPNVELPDFVITGKDVISVRRVKKMNPEFVPIVTQDFIKPLFTPEQLEITDLSNPIENDLQLLDSVDYYKGILTLNAGRYTLPGGMINYAFPFERGMLHGVAIGENQIAYNDNTDRVTYSGALDFNYTVANDAQVIPGTKFSLNGKHKVNKYKFFGSVTPERKRTLNAGSAFVDIQNLFSKYFIFDVKTGGDFTFLDSENFNESIFDLTAFGKLNLDDFALTVKTNYQNQSLETDSLGKNNYGYFFFQPTASFKLFDRILGNAGFTFSSSEGQSLNGIYASLGIEISKNLVLMGEYAPVGEFVTSGKLLRRNYYFDSQTYTNVFVKKKNYIDIILKYEYGKYFQIDGGIKYFRADNLPYFTDTDTSGIFQMATTDAKTFNPYVNFLFHFGPYGVFYASLNLFNIENSAGNKIPYYPDASATATYGYDFKNGLLAKISAEFQTKRFTDIANTNSLKSFFDLGLLLEYKFENNIMLSVQLANIINNKKYLWQGYQEKPFDITFGASYLFN